MADKLNHELLTSLNEAVTRIDTTVGIMNDRLFGKNGQQGAISYLDDQHKELVGKVESKADGKDLRDLSNKHDDLNSKVSWFSGVGATITFLISVVLTYMGIHYPPSH